MVELMVHDSSTAMMKQPYHGYHLESSTASTNTYTMYIGIWSVIGRFASCQRPCVFDEWAVPALAPREFMDVCSTPSMDSDRPYGLIIDNFSTS